MVFTCSGCAAPPFKNLQALTVHRRNCKGAARNSQQIIESSSKALSRRNKRQRLSNDQEDTLDLSHDTEPTAAINTNRNDTELDAGEAVNHPASPTLPTFVPVPTRSGRERKFPKHYTDMLPNSSTYLPHLPPAPPRPKKEPSRRNKKPESPSTPPSEPEFKYLRSEINDFGLYRVYPSFPTCEINEADNLDNLCDAPGLAIVNGKSDNQWWKAFGIKAMDATSNRHAGLFTPFMNATVFRLVNWFYSGSNLKSAQELDRLVQEVLLADDFDTKHLENFSAKREFRRLDEIDPQLPISSTNSWKTSTVKLSLPAEKVSHESESHAPVLEVPNVHHRSLVEVIKSALEDESAKNVHYTPFRLFWQPTKDSTPERVVSELYNSEAFYEEHVRLQQQPREPGCNLEVAIAGLMLWSDSTHLAQFGNASLWPIYLFLGNQSQYFRAKPKNFAAHHVAYIPALPSFLQDIYMKAFNGLAASSATITHLKRELIHAICLLLLDPEFMHAYQHGIVIKCSDGIVRRIFPRIFTYSADYPEKILLATIRYLAKCPCPRCLMPMFRIGDLGTRVDDQRRQHTRVDTASRQHKVEISRQHIFERGKGVKSTAVENLLQEDSSTPTRNAFSTRLFQFGFNYFSMFVPDLLHEFELGVWKATFSHLLRILHAHAENSIQKLNERYRQVETFGQDTIRMFSNNASAMKKLAARDFEDLLQCSMPVFEGLLPRKHDEFIQDMLFTLCTWHAYAKLRLQTTSTLNGLKATTKTLGKLLRVFAKDICSQYDTVELPQEEAARKGKLPANSQRTTRNSGPIDDDDSNTQSKRRKTFNMLTYKLHALGDYVVSIWRYGPSSGYSTQIGELEHRRVKRFYAKTNKGRTFEWQITRHQRRERLLHAISEREKRSKRNLKDRSQQQSSNDFECNTYNAPHVPFIESDTLPPTLPQLHHHISANKRLKDNIHRWLYTNENDPALKTFLRDLKNHLLSRLLGHSADSDEYLYYSDEDRYNVQIVNNLMFRHKLLRINYTTYDVRRQQDTINARTHADIMTLSGNTDDNAHPYAYGRVLGIFHVDVKHRGQLATSNQTHRMNFLWIRWFEIDPNYIGGWKTKRLHRIRFINSSSPLAFGFLNPADVIRACHLIPAFAHGSTREYLGPSIARSVLKNRINLRNEDWRFMYINMFVDRDMFMRYLGGGVGHHSTNEYTIGLRPDIHDIRNVFAVPQDGIDDIGAYGDGYLEDHSDDGNNDLESGHMDHNDALLDEEDQHEQLLSDDMDVHPFFEPDPEDFNSEDDDWGYKSPPVSCNGSDNENDDLNSDGSGEDEIGGSAAADEENGILYEPNIGAEDGEEPWGMGDEEAEGYGVL
ncbi:hypothetical protein JR316_0001494 [Psilocybe cubensis]|uniref:Uncharacterized protein n=2 Tax=Psilocybe cubensis TaxID=181762 RepID=A0A8H7Y6P7_PSICU|nr:hypothetical protein JR316_0001494 [Psilocybe cubensis]KAH9487419.1 hypothetical protein JR316_0001494 [Psilocybe cubensis]